jgi:hypothetical protein
MKQLIVVLILMFSTTVSASGKKEINQTKEVENKVVLKEGGAVTAFSKDDGFKLTKKAIKNLGVSFMGLNNASSWIVPKSSIVRIKNSTGVYRKYDGWITMVLVEVLKKKSDGVLIKSIDLQNGDEVAISGVKFLRITDADLNSDTVDACAH